MRLNGEPTHTEHIVAALHLERATMTFLTRSFLAPATQLFAPRVARSRSLVNPVINSDFPDPGILRVGADYYAYATNTGGVNVQVAKSSDLMSWSFVGDALPILPGW